MSHISNKESEELTHFRERWKAEVQARTTGTVSTHGSSDRASEVESISQTAVASNSTASISTGITPVELYRRAVAAEGEGRLDDALALYRQAFRRHPEVDRLYHREEEQSHRAYTSFRKSESTALEHCDAPIETTKLHNDQCGPVTHTALKAVLAAFPAELTFLPEDENKPLPIQILPLEILVHVLLQLAYRNDVSSIERFAATSKKARTVTLDPVIWRYLVESTYVPPQIPRLDFVRRITFQFNADYRQLYIEYPRLRLDGVYIAVCHYTRQGLSENAWVNVSHLITYHRYLRFLPSGDALSLLANEDTDPQEVVHLLKPDLRMKGFMKGSWHLEDSTVHVANLKDPVRDGKYTYQMLLHLKSRPLGRWNKLDLTGYASVEVETGDRVPFSLRHNRPFWFSKVKSYYM